MASTTDNADANNVPARSEKPRLGGDFAEGFSSLSLLRQAGLMVGLAASVAIGFAVLAAGAFAIFRSLKRRPPP